MKLTFEFDTSSENFDIYELERHEQAENLAVCLYGISNKVKGWYKYDNREAIPPEEIKEQIDKIIIEYVRLDRLGYYRSNKSLLLTAFDTVIQLLGGFYETENNI